MIDPKAYAQLPTLLPEESRSKELDDSTGNQFIGSLASVAHTAHSLEPGKDVAIDRNKHSHEKNSLLVERRRSTWWYLYYT